MVIPCYSNLLAIFITFFLLLARKVNSYTTNTYSFNYSSFNKGPRPLTLQGDAKVLENGVLALTSGEDLASKTGRALYPLALDIWDNNTGNVAHFVTSFSFVVRKNAYRFADGLIFFIAPAAFSDRIHCSSGGGNLGVVDGNNAFNQFVGVEFDTYIDALDPSYKHVGIDVNSLISLKTARYYWEGGSFVTVNIIYDSLSKTLSVAVACSTTAQATTVSQVVDLKAVLPQKVIFGFSAATTYPASEKHEIHSWSFTTNLVTSIDNNINNIASYA